MASIVIPVRGSTDTVEVFRDELPADPADVVDLLRAELAPLDIWCDFAVAYHISGRREQFREILLGVVDAFDVYEMQDFYRQNAKNFAGGRLRVLNLLAASATASFVGEELRKEAREAWRQKALEYIGRADKVDPNCEATWLCKSIFWIGELHHDPNALRNAAYYADSALRSERSVTAQLAKAAILFHEGKHQEALRLYAGALGAGGSAVPPSVRLGVGLCAYHLGDRRTALAAFERVLALDPANTEALVGAAVLRLEIAEARQKGAASAAETARAARDAATASRMIARAADLKPTYSIALNQLAHQLFWLWKKAEWTVSADVGSEVLVVLSDPSALVSVGVDLRLGGSAGSFFEAQVVAVDERGGGEWAIRIDKPFSPLGLDVAVDLKALVVTCRDQPRVDDLASRAYHCTAVPEVRAEAYFILGRNRHARGDAAGALPYYTQACKLAPKFALALFRLAQVRAAVGDFPAALESAEAAMAVAPKAPEVLRFVGALRLQAGTAGDSAREALKAAVKDSAGDAGGDAGAFLDLAAAYQSAIGRDGKAAAEAIQAYERAMELGAVDAAVPNNVAVLQLELGNTDKAVAALFCALRKCATGEDSVPGPLCCAENAPLWDWVAAGTVVRDAVDSWAFTLTGHAVLEKGEVVRIGDGADAVVTRVDAEDSLKLVDKLREDSATLYRVAGKAVPRAFAAVYANLAQVHAAGGATAAALELARAVLAVEPDHDRCLLLVSRLHCDARDYKTASDGAQAVAAAVKKRRAAASSVASEAETAALNEGCADLLAVVGSLQRDAGASERTIRAVEQLRSLSTGLKNDSFANVALAELHFCGLLKDGSSEPRAQREVQLKRAADAARAALRQAASCAAAAHALGLVLLEDGCTDDAAAVFLRICDAGPGAAAAEQAGAKRLGGGGADASLNLAHIRAMNGRWSDAAALYANVSRSTVLAKNGHGAFSAAPPRAQGRRAHVHAWLARAKHGALDFSGARQALSSAVHLKPWDVSLRSHGAVISLEGAFAAQKQRSARAEDVLDSLKHAGRVFAWLGEQSELENAELQLKRISALALRCDGALKHAPGLVEREREREANTERLRDAQRAQLARVLSERTVREEAALAAVAAAKEINAAKARERQAQLDQLQSKWRARPAEEPKKGAKRPASAPADDDEPGIDFGSGSEDEGGGEKDTGQKDKGAKATKAKKAKKKMAIDFGSDDDDDDDDAPPAKKPAAAIDFGSDDDGDDAPPAASAIDFGSDDDDAADAGGDAGDAPKTKKRKIVEDEDEDED